MSRPKPSEMDLQERELRRQQWRQEWKQFREEHSLTQLQLAEGLNISRRTVQLIETGRVSPSRATLQKFQALKAERKPEKRPEEYAGSAEHVTLKRYRCVCHLPGCIGRGRPWLSAKDEIPKRCTWCKRERWYGSRARNATTQPSIPRGAAIALPKPQKVRSIV